MKMNKYQLESITLLYKILRTKGLTHKQIVFVLGDFLEDLMPEELKKIEEIKEPGEDS